MQAFPLVAEHMLPASNAFFASRRFPPVSFGRPGIATLQNPQNVLMNQLARYQAKETVTGLEEQETMEENLGPMVHNDMPDADLARAQLARGGDYLRSVLPAGSPQPKPAPGGFDYSGVKPIRSDDELFQNPKFSALARSNPAAAAKVYKAVTGRDMGSVLENKRKMEAARGKDFTEAIRGSLARGDIRQNPDTGLIERKVSMPDPNNPLGKVDAWETAEAEFQGVATQHWEGATGMRFAKPNPLTQGGIPAQMQPMLLALYRRNLTEGKLSPQDAMREAVKALPTTTQQINTTPTPHAAAASPPPTDPVKFQEWATAQAKASGGNVANWAADKAVGAMRTVDMATEDAGRIMGNMATGIYNLPNRISTFFGGEPLYDWARPTSKAEMEARRAEITAAAARPLTAEEIKRAAQTRYRRPMQSDDPLTGIDLAPNLMSW